MKKRRIVLAVILILSVGAVAYGYHMVTGSSEGSITKATTKPDTTSANIARIAVTNEYAEFSYPAKFTPIGSEKPIEPILLNYNYTKRQIGSWQVGIQIGRLPSGKLRDEGTFNYRSVTNTRFTKTERLIGDNQTIIFSDTTSETFAKTGYIQHKNLFASISLNGGTVGNYNQLQADFDELIASWRWL